MSAAAQLWAAVKSGIILVLATRNEAKISSSGEFVSYFVYIFALVLIIFATERKFFGSVQPRFAQFDSLRQAGMTVAQLVTLYLIYVLAAGVEDWFQKTYMNGPYVIELALTVVLIILILTVLGIKFAQFSSPKQKHVEHLLKISQLAVQLNTRS